LKKLFPGKIPKGTFVQSVLGTNSYCVPRLARPV
jgi:hypothetical protein